MSTSTSSSSHLHRFRRAAAFLTSAEKRIARERFRAIARGSNCMEGPREAASCVASVLGCSAAEGAAIAEQYMEPGSLMSLEILLGVLGRLKEDRRDGDEEEAATRAAFVAMGGQADGTGHAQREAIERAIKDTGLAVDYEAMLQEIDGDGSGTIEYDEFRTFCAKPG